MSLLTATFCGDMVARIRCNLFSFSDGAQELASGAWRYRYG